MPLFKNIVTRDVTESVEIIVEADNIEEANSKLVNVACSDLNLKWERDDGNPTYPYLGDEGATEQLDIAEYRKQLEEEVDNLFCCDENMPRHLELAEKIEQVKQMELEGKTK